MSDKEPINFQKLIHEKMKTDGPAIYAHLGFEHDHLTKMMDLQREDDTIRFHHSLYMAEVSDSGDITGYTITDSARFIGHLKRKYNEDNGKRLRNMTSKNVFFFSDYPDVFKEAKADGLPFVILTYVSKEGVD